MKANELRIGNYIAASGNPDNVETWVIGKVYSISSLDVEFEQIEVETDEEFTWFFKDSYFAIPLTEEWLLKLWFEKEKNVIPMYSKGELTIVPECNEYPKGRVYFNSWAIIKHTIKHVHQLQNLYFALTGEELK